MKNILPKKKYLLYLLGVFLITLCAFFVYSYTTKKSAQNIENRMFVYTNIYLSAMDEEQISKLTNTASDLQNPAFIKLSEQLESMWAASKNTNIRWMYTMFLEGEDFVFGPDSTPFGEFGYVDPGYVYSSISPEDKEILMDDVILKGKQVKTGPYPDEWGSWISFFVPINDINSSKTTGVFGIDVDYNVYKSMIFKDQLVVIISYLFSIILYSLIFFYIQYIEKNKIELSQIAEHEKQKINELENMSSLMIDRELKMLDLKNKVKELENK